MLISELSSVQTQEADSAEEDSPFEKSLQELRDLRSQLHYAADYSEKSFFNSEEKEVVLGSTKEYICRAVVTFIDHLGNVSANLNQCIPENKELSEAELRINCMSQRLLLCELYAHKLALGRVRWSPKWPVHHRRYLSTPMTKTEKSNDGSRDVNAPRCVKFVEKNGFDTEDLPLFMYTRTDKSTPAKTSPLKTAIQKCESGSSLVPVRDNLSIPRKDPTPTFHFQRGTQKRRSFYRKPVQILIRRARRATR